MPDMLRGTVWIVVEGVPELRRILAMAAVSAEDFKSQARAIAEHWFTKDSPTVLEFGPIGPPWGPPHA